MVIHSLEDTDIAMRKTQAQSLGEYAVVLALVGAVIIGMGIYVKRGIQARLKGVSDYGTKQLQATSQWTSGMFGEYRPSKSSSRAEMAVMLFRAFGDSAYTPPAVSVFPDVPTDYWAYKEISYLAEEGIIVGYDDGLYHPDYGDGDELGVITRDQAAVYLANVLGLAPYTGEQIFDDVPPDYWAYGAIGALHEEGIVTGYTPTEYRPTQICNRDQMAVFIARALDLAPYEGYAMFLDVPPGNWAFGAIGALYKAGVVKGFETPDGRKPSSQFEPDYQQSVMNTLQTSNKAEVLGIGGTVRRKGGSGVKPSYYGPEQTVSRGQAAEMLFSFMKAKFKDSDYSHEEYSGPQIFNDVVPDYWAYSAIGALATNVFSHKKDVEPIIEVGSTPNVFLASDNITRAAFAEMLCKALNLDPSSTSAFPDVPNSLHESGYINALAKEGIVFGYTDGNFHPDWNLTRNQEAVMLYNAYGYNCKAFGDEWKIDPYTGEQMFVDVPAGSGAYAEIGAILGKGITDGITDDSFREETTRSGYILSK